MTSTAPSGAASDRAVASASTGWARSWSASKMQTRSWASADRFVARRDVAVVEAHPVGHSLGLGVRARRVDRRLVDVVAVDARLRVRARDRDARPALAAREVGDARAGRLQPLVHVGKRGQPFRSEEVRELHAVEVGLRLARIGAIGVPRDAAAGTEGLGDRGQRAGHGDGDARERRGERERVAVGERLGMAGRQREAAIRRGRVEVVDLEDPADGLLLEPLPRVAGVDAGHDGELARCERPLLGERAVQPQAVADVDAEEIDGAEHGAEDALGEGLALLLVLCGEVRGDGHDASLRRLRERSVTTASRA
jgi:hypothetical protein